MNDRMTPDEFTDLFRHTAPRLRTYAVRHVGVTYADDLVSETYAVAWRRRERIGDPPLAWLFVVARNLAANHYRSQQRSRDLWVAMVGDLWRSSSAGSPEAQVLDRETALTALRGCSATDREALLLTAWDGLSADEAGLVLHCSARAFTVRLHRARARFDRLYRAAESGGSLTDVGEIAARVAVPRLDTHSPVEELS